MNSSDTFPLAVNNIPLSFINKRIIKLCLKVNFLAEKGISQRLTPHYHQWLIAHKQNIKHNATIIESLQERFLNIYIFRSVQKVSKICTKDGALPLALFVTISGNYTVTFSSAISVSPFLIITQDLVGNAADTLLLRGQLAKKEILQKVSKIFSLYNVK